MPDPRPVDAEVDALGLLCPLPILRTERAVRRLSAGGLVRVLADDPAIVDDLPAWCAGQGHDLVALRRARDATGRTFWEGLLRVGGALKKGPPGADS